METKRPSPITPFDEMTIPASLRMLKLLLPYMPPSIQKTLAVFIRFQEIKSTISFFRQNNFENAGRSFSDPDFLQTIFKDLSPFLRPEEKEMAENVQNMMQMMEMIQSMSNPEDIGQFFNMNSLFSEKDFSPSCDSFTAPMMKAASHDG